MDENLKNILEKKIETTLEKTDEIKEIIKSLDELSNSDDFAFGIIIGRLYNSFYYQSRRILKRDPTSEEFSEFLAILKNRQSEIFRKFQK